MQNNPTKKVYTVQGTQTLGTLPIPIMSIYLHFCNHGFRHQEKHIDEPETFLQ